MTVDRVTDVEISFRVAQDIATRVMSKGAFLAFDTNGHVRLAGAETVEGVWWNKPTPDFGTPEPVTDDRGIALTWPEWTTVTNWLYRNLPNLDNETQGAVLLHLGIIDVAAVLKKANEPTLVPDAWVKS